MDLKSFNSTAFDRGRPAVFESLWIIVSHLLFSTFIPGYAWRRTILRLFGAKIGKGVVIKPHVVIKFPWKLSVGDHSWIGESVWIDNIDIVDIGSNCCISQGVYMCTGNHDWSKSSFDLIIKPIIVKDRAWVAAKALVAPGVTIGEGAILSIGSVACSDLQPWQIYQGNPAKELRMRNVQ